MLIGIDEVTTISGMCWLCFQICRDEPEWLCAISRSNCTTWCSCTWLASARIFTDWICPHLPDELCCWKAKVKQIDVVFVT